METHPASIYIYIYTPLQQQTKHWMVVSAFSIFHKRDENAVEGDGKDNSLSGDTHSPEEQVQEPFIPAGRRATFFKKRTRGNANGNTQTDKMPSSSSSSSDSESFAAAVDKWGVDGRPPLSGLTPSKLSLFTKNDSSNSESEEEISIDKQNVLALVAQTTLSQRAESGEESSPESEVELSAAENDVNDVISIGSEDESAEEHQVYDADERDDEVTHSQEEEEGTRPRKRTRSVKTEPVKRTERKLRKSTETPAKILPPSSPPSESENWEPDQKPDRKPGVKKYSKRAKQSSRRNPKETPKETLKQKPKQELVSSPETLSEYDDENVNEPDLEVVEVKNLDADTDISLIDAKDFEPNERKNHKERKRILRHSTYVSRRGEVRNGRLRP